jgi:hypothetical protein
MSIRCEGGVRSIPGAILHLSASEAPAVHRSNMQCTSSISQMFPPSNSMDRDRCWELIIIVEKLMIVRHVLYAGCVKDPCIVCCVGCTIRCIKRVCGAFGSCGCAVALQMDARRSLVLLRESCECAVVRQIDAQRFPMLVRESYECAVALQMDVQGSLTLAFGSCGSAVAPAVE